MIVRVLLGLNILIATRVFAAAPPSCTPRRAALTADAVVTVQGGYDRVSFYDTRTGEALDSPADATQGWRVLDSRLQTATLYKNSSQYAADQIQLRWTKSANPSEACLQAFDMAPGRPAAPAESLQPPLPGEPGSCQGRFREKLDALRQERRKARDDFTLIVFSYDGSVCGGPSRPYSVQGEPIYVGLYDDRNNPHVASARLEVAPCSIEAPGVRLFAPADFSGIKISDTQASRRLAPPDWQITMFPARVCYDPSVVLAVKGQKTGSDLTTVGQYTLGQVQRYHATIQLGAIFTDLQNGSFDLRTDGEIMRIRDRSTEGTGPEYVAAVLFYALPRQLRSIWGERYEGRDIIHDNTLADRIGAVLGVGLSKPSERFIAGLSLELLPGLNMLGVHELAKVKRLNGVEPDDPFSGPAAEIPTRETWENRTSFGLSVDLRYATALFKR